MARLNEADWIQVEKDVASGITFRDIAEKYTVSIAAISKHMKLVNKKVNKKVNKQPHPKRAERKKAQAEATQPTLEGLPDNCQLLTGKALDKKLKVYNPNLAREQSIYTEDLADEICYRVSEGQSLRDIAADPLMPAVSTIHAWRLDPGKAGFARKYSIAMMIKREVLQDEILQIADDDSDDYIITPEGEMFLKKDKVVRDKFRFEARKYLIDLIPGNHSMAVIADGGDSNQDQAEDAVIVDHQLDRIQEHLAGLIEKRKQAEVV